jgi:hypothetical protein
MCREISATAAERESAKMISDSGLSDIALTARADERAISLG